MIKLVQPIYRFHCAHLFSCAPMSLPKAIYSHQVYIGCINPNQDDRWNNFI